MEKNTRTLIVQGGPMDLEKNHSSYKIIAELIKKELLRITYYIISHKEIIPIKIMGLTKTLCIKCRLPEHHK